MLILLRAGNREVLCLPVKCENSGAGCEWTGELRSLDEHKITCQYILTKCPQNCDTMLYELKGCVPKKDLELHIKEECPKREYKCPHCGEGGIYGEISTSHLENCLYVPVLCPNEGCGQEVCSSFVTIHMATECEFEVVECKHKANGCDVHMMRKDLDKHEKDDRFHFQVIMRAVKDLRRELDSVKTESSHATVASHGDVKEPSHVKTLLLQDEVKELRASSLAMKDQIKQLEDKVARAISNVKPTVPAIFPTIVFKVNNFFSYAPGTCYTSSPFYTSEQGFKLCISVYPNAKNYVKVMVHLMKGEYDSNLDWPFCGRITITLLNQKLDSSHSIKVVEYLSEGGNRLYGSDKSAIGYGHDRFIHHKHLVPRIPSGQRNPRQRHSGPVKSSVEYAPNNTVYFRVTATASKAWLECSPVMAPNTAAASASASAHNKDLVSAIQRQAILSQLSPFSLFHLASSRTYDDSDDYDDPDDYMAMGYDSDY